MFTLPLTNVIDIYRYSDEVLKHTPIHALKTIQNDLLYSKDKVAISAMIRIDVRIIQQQTRQREIEPMKIWQTGEQNFKIK